MSHSNSGSDDEAPEVVSKATAKRIVDNDNARVGKHVALEANAAKERNRKRDAQLKAQKLTREREASKIERAVKKRERRATRKPTPIISVEDEDSDEHQETEAVSEIEDEETLRIQRRMEAAMEDAQNEDSEIEQDDKYIGGASDDGLSAEDSDLDSEMNEDLSERNLETWEGIGGGSGDEEQVVSSSANPDYLPEEIFQQASASIRMSALKETHKTKKEKVIERKKRKKKSLAKDRLIGSRKITVMPSVSPAGLASQTVPSKPVQHFVNKQLKGGRLVKGWERRPANVGSMRSGLGPARLFNRVVPI